jgi:hypothetical protein
LGPRQGHKLTPDVLDFAASIGFVNEGCSPRPRLRGAAGFQQKQSQNGEKGSNLRVPLTIDVPLTIETISSLKIPDPIYPRSPLERVPVATICPQRHSFNEEVQR